MLSINDGPTPPWFRHVAYVIDGSALAVSTVKLTAPICQFYVLGRDGSDLEVKKITDAERDMLLAFECSEDITRDHNVTSSITHLYNHGGEPKVFKFVVER